MRKTAILKYIIAMKRVVIKETENIWINFYSFSKLFHRLFIFLCLHSTISEATINHFISLCIHPYILFSIFHEPNHLCIHPSTPQFRPSTSSTHPSHPPHRLLHHFLNGITMFTQFLVKQKSLKKNDTSKLSCTKITLYETFERFHERFKGLQH